MKVYHYTKFDDWLDLSTFGGTEGYEPHLIPDRRLGTEEKRASDVAGLFALFSPTPEEWVQNKDFPEIWKTLKKHVGPLLLEIDVNENDPSVYVVDWGHMETHVRGSAGEATDRAQHEAAYIETKMPLKDYLARKDVLKYSLPEIVFTKKVPLDRVRVSEFQPLLEERLTEYKSTIPNERLVKEIREVPELQSWFARYNEGTEGRTETRKNYR